MGLLLWNTASNAPYPGAPSSSDGLSNWDRRGAISSSSTQQRQHPTRTHPSATRPSHLAETSSPPGPDAGRRYVPTEERDDCHHRKVRRIRSAASATPHRDNHNGPPGGPFCLTIPHQEEDHRRPPDRGGFNGRRSRSRGPSARGALVSSSLFATTLPAGQSGTTRRRPPSLERQGAFRDERTARRRRRWAPSGEDDDDDDDDEHRQDAERCRIRLLLNDERELDKGFAPDRIAREGPGCYCYYCCSLPTWRPRGQERRGEDEALAGWLLSGSSSSSSTSSFSTSRLRQVDAVREEVPPWRDEASYDGQQLTVIHELADDLSDDVLLSGVSSVAGQVDDRTVWAVLDDRNHLDAAAFQAVGAMVVGMDESRRSSGYAGHDGS
ncbi:hypothetical protein MYCTH_2306063 [Thermothelomyces thermophilus ATCC 42464]|uniref:Uncharacterized protein n=1 Tax=Thermothelomyces thermophilus (strain ATCC 42464 / BCRC 31852 / DSM 1799) TaxID=573729 RepID=G2QGP6_THET4|nr:uncharacterized protein MYCTH_2306063 [Thermothelomyces thermophilus ATCC 42464]AEO58608.1 hypothetical protein MYCTH_2306063 [Thermothelomyces thermophilus ATCC 42464]